MEIEEKVNFINIASEEFIKAFPQCAKLLSKNNKYSYKAEYLETAFILGFLCGIEYILKSEILVFSSKSEIPKSENIVLESEIKYE